MELIKIKGQVILKRGRESSVLRRHPWVFSGAIHKSEGSVCEGCWVSVADSAEKVIGFGHYQEGSIAVRILSFGDKSPDEGFYSQKLTDAISLRRLTQIENDKTNCYRLVHGEGDGLPGLIIDYYDGVCVMQAHSTGIHEDRLQILEALRKVYQGNLRSVYYQDQHGGSDVKKGYLFGVDTVPHAVVENGNRFLVDWEGGQKTGFFLDQRDNRRLLAEYAKGRSVLNMFCYTGGFSVYALQAGAILVNSVDASSKAIEMTRKNIELNGFSPDKHACFAEDTFDFFHRSRLNVALPYDIIILDPPAFAKHRDARHQAMKGYQRLNAEAMRLIKSGGLIFTFSCSQVVDRQLFYDTMVSAAVQTGRTIRVLHHLSQPADHPVSIYHPEGEYLKGLVLHVE